MIKSVFHTTSRMRHHCLEYICEDKEPLLFVHGNVSSSAFWMQTMEKLTDTYSVIAPDLRGFGESSTVRVDATRGLLDFTDDILELLDTLSIERCHMIGHSLGSNILFAMMAYNSSRVKSATLVSPGSPYGFGGTKGNNGEPCWPDFAGSGAGLTNSDFVEHLKEQDESDTDPVASPRNVMNTLYWNADYKAPNEDQLLQAMLSTQVGNEFYPGDLMLSHNFPFYAPGNFGPVNAISPKYNTELVPELIECSQKPPILWVRGAKDVLVSDQAVVDPAVLGGQGLLEGYPGVDEFPPQPMNSQTRYVLENYVEKGGVSEEVVMEQAGHSPHIEKSEEFISLLKNWISR
jgi:pimeloyl-ACP methyl ester carboxylesterase